MKKVIRFIAILSILFGIGLMGILGTYLLVDTATLAARVAKAIESATGTRISYHEDARITRTLSPVLSLHNFSIESENKSFKFQTSSLKLQISLPGLLFGNLEIPMLALGNTLVEINEESTPKELKKSQPFPLTPVLKNLKINQISIISGNNEINLSKMNLKNFNVQPNPKENQLICTLKIELKGTTFDITATLPRVQEILESKQLTYFLDIKNKLSHLLSEGVIDFSQTPALIKADVTADAKNIKGVFPDNFGPVQTLSFYTSLSGDISHMTLRECRLAATTMEGLDLNATGQLNLINDTSGIKPENLDVSLTFTAPDTHAARILFFDNIPEFGAIKGKLKIFSKKEDPSIEGIIIKTVDTDGIQVDLNGRIDKFPLDADISNTGYDLNVLMTSARTSVMGDRVGLDLPLVEPLNLSYKIQGDSQALELNNINLSIGENVKNQMRVAGKILFENWDLPDPIKTMDLTLKINTPETKTLESIVGRELPEFGPVSAQARLHTVSKSHRMDGIKVRIGKTDPLKITATGLIDKIAFFPDVSIEGIQLLTNVSGKDTAALTDIVHLNTTLPSMGSFKASAKITGNNQIIGAQEVLFESDLSDKGKSVFDLTINGQFKDLSNIDTLVLNAQVISRDLKTIGSLLAQKWPAIGPVKLNSAITKENEKIKLKTEMIVDDVQIKATNSIFFQSLPVRINGIIQAENFFLPDLTDLKNSDADEEKDNSPYFFSRKPIEFDWLKKASVDLSVDILSFDKKQSRFESAFFKIEIESDHLSVRPAKLKFPSGNLEIDMDFNMKKTFELNIKASAENINPYQALSMEKIKNKDDFDADIDLDIDITSSGISEHELASNLNGDIYMNIKNGRLRKDLLNLLFVDLIGWTLNKAIGKKYVNIHCGVMDYRIQKGVVTTDAFFLDGENVTIAGEGTIDLGQEEIDYVFLPKKKSSLVLRADPVKIKGTLGNPSITAIPWRSAVKTYGSLIFSPYVFAGQVVGTFIKDVLTSKTTTSLCAEYEKKHAQGMGKKNLDY